VLTVRTELTDRMLIFGDQHLRVLAQVCSALQHTAAASSRLSGCHRAVRLCRTTIVAMGFVLALID
jgi:hypothetical protein